MEALSKTNQEWLKIEAITPSITQSNQMDYSTKTREELIALCKDNKIKGYSGKKKDDIIELLTKLPSEITPQNAIVNTSIVGIIPSTDVTNIKYILKFSK